MEAQLKQCVMYVDYEGLLSGLSRSQHLDIDNLLLHLLAKARQRFQVQHAVVLGDWTYHQGRAQLEAQGFLCRSLSTAETAINQMLYVSISEQIAANQAAEMYILVSNQSDYNAILRTLQQANKACVLWTLLPPPPSDQALCSEWEVITPLESPQSSSWPRQVMLQAIALAADHLQGNTDTPFLLSRLRDHLVRLSAFNSREDAWLAIAIREHILLQESSDFDVYYGYVNRQHAVVQKAQLIRERILSTFSTLLTNREWVAFSVLEKALRTTRVLADHQSFRHAWIELLVAEDVLMAQQIPQPDGPFQVTALRPNPAHSAMADLQRIQQHNLIRLIVHMRDVTGRKGKDAMAVSTLLKSLTGATTRVEASAALDHAKQQDIVHLETVVVPSRSASPVTVVRLQQGHALVQETLARRDQCIQLTNAIIEQRKTGVSETILAEALMAEQQIEKDEALFWIRLLVNEDILYVKHILLESQETVPIIYLNQQDVIVDQLLDQTSRDTGEVK